MRQSEKWRLFARRTTTSTSSTASSTSNSASSSTLCSAPSAPPTTSPLLHHFLLLMLRFEGWESEELEEEWTKEAITITIRSPRMTWQRCQIWLRVQQAWSRAEGSRTLTWSLPLRMTIGFDDLEKNERLSGWGWRLKGGPSLFSSFFLFFFSFSFFIFSFFYFLLITKIIIFFFKKRPNLTAAITETY